MKRKILIEAGSFVKCPVVSLMPLRIHEKPIEGAKIAEEKFRRDFGCGEKEELIATVEVDDVVVELHGKPDCITMRDGRIKIYEYKNISRESVSIWAVMEKVAQAALYSLILRLNGKPNVDAHAVFEVQGRRYVLRIPDELVRHAEKWVRSIAKREVPYKHIKCDNSCRYFAICRFKERLDERIVDDMLLKYSIELAQEVSLPIRPLRYVIST